MAVSEVAVFCDHDTVFLICSGGYLGVRAAATSREGRDVDGVMSCLAEQGDELSRELRVDKELHAALSGVALPMPKAKAVNIRESAGDVQAVSTFDQTNRIAGVMGTRMTINTVIAAVSAVVALVAVVFAVTHK